MSQYPLVTVKFAEDEPSLAAIDQFFDELDVALSKTTGPYVTKSYGGTKFVSSEVRVKIGKRSHEITKKYLDRSVGSVIVTDSMIGKMMLKGVMLVMKQQIPTKVVASEEEADAAIAEFLGQPA